MQHGIKKYDDKHFYESMIDSSWVMAINGGLKQYETYCKHIGIDKKIDRSKKIPCQSEISGVLSLETAKHFFPVLNCTV